MKSTGQKLKPVKCKWCKESYIRMNSLQKACSPSCALALTRRDTLRKEQKKEREKRRELQERKEQLKTIPDLVKEAQKAFNAYVRFRDRDLPCISCNRPQKLVYGGSTDCGHYRSTGSAKHLRFHLWNACAQCVYCNRNLSGNVADYRIGLINRIGIEKVEWLENNNEVRKLSREYLTRLRDVFRKKLNRAKRRENRL